MTNGRHVLVAGASGLVGQAAVHHFSRAGWRVTGVSRRRPKEMFGAEHISVDLADPGHVQGCLGGLGVTHVVYAALFEQPTLVDSWTESDHVVCNGAMLKNLMEVLDGEDSTLEHVTLLQGPKAYGVHTGGMEFPSHEDRSERREIPNFYWAQEDYLKERQVGRSWAWTVIRPCLVVGGAIGSPMNLVAAVAVYGWVMKELGKPMHYPGPDDLMVQATDTDLMARSFLWAAEADEARNQIFNVTNGEMFSMKNVWPRLVEALGLEQGGKEVMALSEEMPKHSAVWDHIREKHGLDSPSMDDYVAQSFQFTDWLLGHGQEIPRPPLANISDIKVRAAGFHDVLNSEDMFAKWVGWHQDNNLIPKAPSA